MYVCVCRAVSDREVNAAIDAGARTMRELRRELGVCSCCGKCGPAARAMLAERTAPDENAPALGFPAATPAVA
ncbi:hypothetical protein KBTX_01243 [wastewater metagenome]|uniref:Bacterioferritin-associated ferredoxin n=2 Tax=unclassified sequences TaxID=12908 RepID=A0A5B8RDP6_9ZZZZ|nr:MULTISPECIES: (2Fe-2S)-binding protein [Arhodomonas]MCS4504210.1 (2Fe-2S)-binding protein [Arhodomonas aquaeolei]QEA04925.1 hypothetical protein KBTEX_01243 [uncultured organism]